MKKIITTIALLLTLFVATAQIGTFNYYRITNAGGTVLISPFQMANSNFVYISGAVTLGADYEINTSSVPPVGFKTRIYFDVGGIDLNGFAIRIGGHTLTQPQIDFPGYYDFLTVTDHSGGVATVYAYSPWDLQHQGVLPGWAIADTSISLSALDTVGAGRILIGDASNNLTSATVSGDVTINSSAITDITAGVILNADVNAAAAIARTKLASGTASHVVINDGSGVFSSEATLATSRGGLGTNASASTGIVSFSSGTATIGTLTDSKTITVSFDSTDVGDFRGDNKVYFPFAGTITGLYAYAVTDISGVNNGTIVPKNNSGTTMGSGTITFTAADPKGTAYTSVPATNNTFIAGDILYFTSAKSDDPGGQILLTITYTRNN